MLDQSFKGKAKRLEDIDLPRIGAEIGVGEDELHAFMDVEAAGSGFDSQGRPKMLFEPHLFYRHLSGEARDQAVKEGLAYEKWGTRPYPTDSYPRLIEALKYGEEVALMSASWGLGQILGKNYGLLNYQSVQDMVQAFMDDEDTHLQGMVDFLKAEGLDDDLRAHRWQALARGYNGESYAKNQYDLKLERAYNKWAKIPDTPWEQEEPAVVAYIPRPIIRRGSIGADVKFLQTLLKMANADGVFGPSTEGQVKKYQAQHGLVADGVVGPRTWKALAG